MGSARAGGWVGGGQGSRDEPYLLLRSLQVNIEMIISAPLFPRQNLSEPFIVIYKRTEPRLNVDTRVLFIMASWNDPSSRVSFQGSEQHTGARLPGGHQECSSFCQGERPPGEKTLVVGCVLGQGSPG
jgi:hypothetical protein